VALAVPTPPGLKRVRALRLILLSFARLRAERPCMAAFPRSRAALILQTLIQKFQWWRPSAASTTRRSSIRFMQAQPVLTMNSRSPAATLTAVARAVRWLAARSHQC